MFICLCQVLAVALGILILIVVSLIVAWELVVAAFGI